MTDESLDLTALRRMWETRRAAVASIRRRLSLRGLRRPARDPEERAWLDERGECLFVEDEEAGRAASVYYGRKYNRPAG